MKKTFLLFVVLVLFLSACAKTNSNNDALGEMTEGENSMNESNNNYSSSKKELSLEDKKILSKISNRGKDNIITEIYNEEQIFENNFLSRLYNPMNGYNPTMDMFNLYFGLKVECVRQIDENNYYSVFKIRENGFLYCFFRNSYSILTLYNSCYLKDSLTKNHFDDLKIGDSIENVAKIDSAFSSIYNYYTSVNSKLDYSVHLLKDSLLIIEYENQKIKKIEFNKDFTYSKNGIEYRYKIFEDDYPQQ